MVNGLAGGGPLLNGPFIGGGMGFAITSNGQLVLQLQATGAYGVGLYAGVGLQGGVSKTRCPTPDELSVQHAAQADVNFAIAPYSFGGSAQYDLDGGGGRADIDAESESRCRRWGPGIARCHADREHPTHAETVRSEADARMQMTNPATGFFRGTSRGVRIGSVGFAITAAGALAAVVGTLMDRSWLHWAALAVACVGILVGFVGILYHTVEFFARMRSK